MVRIALILLLIPCILIGASDFNIKAEVSSKRIGLKDLLIYTVTLINDGQAKAPSVSHIKDFTLYQTSHSQSFQSINGAVSYEIKYMYYLKPLKTGSLIIPAMKYKHKGKSYTTPGFRITVVKGSVKNSQPAGRSRRRSIWDDDFGMMKRQRVRVEKDDLMVKAFVTKRNPVEGEQIVCRVKGYSLVQIHDVGITSRMTFPGFWVEWGKGKKRLVGKREVVNGKTYVVFELSKVILFPSKSGVAEIPSFKYRFLASKGNGFSFFNRTEELTRETKPIKLNVSALPQIATGLPIGRFRISLLPYKKSVDVNDILTLKIKLSGEGNVKTLDIPEIAKSDEYKLYPAKTTRRTNMNGNVVTGTVTAEIPVSFSKAGKKTIPSVKFRFYDNKKGKVVEVKTSPAVVQVTGKKEVESSSGGVVIANQDIRRKGEDIRFIARGEFEERSNGFYRTSIFNWLVTIPFLVLIAVALKYYLVDPRLSGSRRPENRVFRETITALKNCDDFGGVCSILDNYIGIKTDTGNSAINVEHIDSVFEKAGVGKQDSKRFIEIRSDSESYRYSGGGAGNDEFERVIVEITGIVERINRKLK